MRVERSVVIERNQADVWAVLSDPALMPEWFSSLDNFVAVEGDGQSAGDVYEIEYLRDSGNKQLTATVLEVDAPDGHVHRFEGLPVAFEITSRLGSDGDATEWNATIEVKLSLVQRALGPMIKGILDDMAADMANGFKSYLEDR